MLAVVGLVQAGDHPFEGRRLHDFDRHAGRIGAGKHVCRQVGVWILETGRSPASTSRGSNRGLSPLMRTKPAKLMAAGRLAKSLRDVVERPAKTGRSESLAKLGDRIVGRIARRGDDDPASDSRPASDFPAHIATGACRKAGGAICPAAAAKSSAPERSPRLSVACHKSRFVCLISQMTSAKNLPRGGNNKAPPRRAGH